MTNNGKSRGLAIDDLRHNAIPATADRLPALRQALAEWAERAGMTPDDTEELVLATYEAMANVIEHAYPDGVGTFDLVATHLPEQHCVEVTVADRGQWRPPPADPGPLHGRGIPLMRDLAQNVALHANSTGTSAVLRWAV